MTISLPPDILDIIGPDPAIERPFQGMAFDTAILSTPRGRFILKIGREPRLAAALAAEHRVLHQLSGHQPFVPAPLVFTIQDGAGISLLSYIEGRNMVEIAKDADPAACHAAVTAYARTLRRIHGWQTSLPQLADWLTRAVDRAARHVAAGDVPDPIDHPGRFNGMRPEELLVELRAWRPGIQNDLVFGHGDYCLPNVLFVDGSISGVIDWPEAGYLDRRYDLATAAWSIIFNLKDPAYVTTFLNAYGYTEPVQMLHYFEALYLLS